MLVCLDSTDSDLQYGCVGIYNSSKSALATISETLRLELAPFGVTVDTLMVGVVLTSFHGNLPAFNLPGTSRYFAIKDIIARRAAGMAGPKGCSIGAFAESIVDDVLGNERSKGAILWKGPGCLMVRFVSSFVPRWMSVSCHSTISPCLLSGGVADDVLRTGSYVTAMGWIRWCNGSRNELSLVEIRLVLHLDILCCYTKQNGVIFNLANSHMKLCHIGIRYWLFASSATSHICLAVSSNANPMLDSGSCTYLDHRSRIPSHQRNDLILLEEAKLPY